MRCSLSSAITVVMLLSTVAIVAAEDACPSSTYASGADCVACPDFSWAPKGSDSIDDCVCWNGYESFGNHSCAPVVDPTTDMDGGWCDYAACSVGCGGGQKARLCGCPRASGNGSACVGEVFASCHEEACDDVVCSSAADEAQCNGWGGCSPVQGFDCSLGRWSSYLGCQSDRVPPQQVQTCAVNTESGARTWLPSALLPAGYVATTTMGEVQACCVPEVYNSTRPPKQPGCTFELGGACVVLQFRGEAPVDAEAALAWIASFVNDLATHLDLGSVNITAEQVAELVREFGDYVTVVDGPTTNNGTATFSCTLQIAPFTNGTLAGITPAQVVAAIMKVVEQGGLSSTAGSQLQGVASYATFAQDQVAAASGADSFARASLLLVLATGIIGTMVAKLASFMQ